MDPEGANLNSTPSTLNPGPLTANREPQIPNPEARFYVLIQIAEFAIGKSIIDFHAIRIGANHEQNASFQL